MASTAHLSPDYTSKGHLLIWQTFGTYCVPTLVWVCLSGAKGTNYARWVLWVLVVPMANDWGCTDPVCV